jgi:hypothetical protein
MRYQKVIWALVGLFAFGVALVLVMTRAARREPPPVPSLVRESLGQLPTPPGAREVVAAFPVDLDDDGNHEVIAVRQRLSARQGDAAIWSDLRGKFETLPIAVFCEYTYTPFPAYESKRPTQPILQREVMGWDATAQRLTRLRREGDAFALAAAGDARFERFPDATIFDADGDGASETLLVYLSQSPLAFRLTAEGRWQPLTEPVPDPSRVEEQLLQQVTTKRMLPSGQVAHSIPAPFMYQPPRPTVPLPDSDGDGKPEQLDVLRRTIRLSRGKQIPFPHPFTAGEQWLVAELDGVAPQEIVYARLNRTFVNSQLEINFEINVYHLKDGKLHTILTHSLPKEYYLALEAMDVDGDGRDELITNTVESGNRARWTVWRYANGALVEQSGEHRTRLRGLKDAEWLMRGKRTLAANTTHTQLRGFQFNPPGSETRAMLLDDAPPVLQAATVLAGVPDGEAAADPAQWAVLDLEGRVVWFGDYDSDGNEEYVLSHTAGGGIAQFRDRQWRYTPLLTGEPIVAAFPAQRNGQPTLIIIYRNGAIEAIRLAR